MTPTPEQQAIFAACKNTDSHLIVDAKAGSGKTTTLIEALPLLRGSISLQAFNKSIAEELKARVSQLGIMTFSRTSVSTVHAHGLNSFRMAQRKPVVQGGKLSFMMKDQMSNYPDHDPVRKNSRHITRLVGMAKAAGFGLGKQLNTPQKYPAIDDASEWQLLIDWFNLELEFEGQISCEQVIEEAQELLKASNRREAMIDFDDMVYLPLLLGLPIKRYDNVLLDEAQDINATRRELAFQSLAPGARMIAVGDARQAIYGFTGAAADGMTRIAQRLGSAKHLPLSICWRCDDAILDEARKIVPGIQTAPHKLGKGLVRSIPFRAEAGQQYAAADFLAMPKAGDAILCRLNKPNVAVALGLLRRGTPAKIEGRDIGKKLLDHARKATEAYGLQPLGETRLELDDYKAREIYKLIQRERESAAALLNDEVEACQLLIDRVLETMPTKISGEWPQLEALVNELFGDDISPRSTVTLSSVHKAKGREWPRVFLLGRSDYMPFFKAELQWEIEQEMNLIYVAITRAEKELVYVTGVASALDKGLHREAALAAPVVIDPLNLAADRDMLEASYD
jgi:DNA helicase-2/ATP-dependent DNA helicase PcrA